MYSDYGTKRFDLAVGASIWLGYKQVRLRLGYDYGLLNRFDGLSSNRKCNTKDKQRSAKKQKVLGAFGKK